VRKRHGATLLKPSLPKTFLAAAAALSVLAGASAADAKDRGNVSRGPSVQGLEHGRGEAHRPGQAGPRTDPGRAQSGNAGGALRNLDRASDVAGTHGADGRVNALTRQGQRR
jgi:hypothetical protein